MHYALVGKEEHVVVRRGDEEVLYKVLLFHVGAGDAFAAAPLLSVARYGQAFKLAGMAYRYDDILFGYQILYVEFFGLGQDFGPARIAELFIKLLHLFFDYIEDLLFAL